MVIKSKLAKAFLALIIFSFIFLQSCEEDKSNTAYNQKISIGALLPLSGAGASPGEAGLEGVMLALNDLRAYLDQNNPSWSVDILVEDTQTDTLVALEKYNIMKTKGIKMIIGPFSSAVLKSLKPYADRDSILLISPASIASSLSEANDNIFRLLPDVTSQGEAMNALLLDEGIELIIPVVRDDIWGKELLEATSSHFISAGFETANSLLYKPDEFNPNTLIQQLSQTLSDELAKKEAQKIGIYMLTYGEGYDLLKAAKGIPQLAEVKWFGNSAFAENNSIIADFETANFAADRDFLCPSFGLDPVAKSIWEPIQTELESKMNRKPEIYAYTSYDAVWLIAKTYMQTHNSQNTQILKQSFNTQARQYIGASGWTKLNNAGDRDIASYDFWGLSSNANSAFWENKAFYNNVTKTLVRIK